MEQTQRLTMAQKRKLEAAKKKLQQQRQQAFEAPQELDNKEIIGNVLKQLIETRLQFVHQKFVLNYLVFQVKQLKKELKIREEILSPSLTHTSNSPVAARRGRLAGTMRDETHAKDFAIEYKVVMDVNQQNYRNIRQEEADDAGDSRG